MGFPNGLEFFQVLMHHIFELIYLNVISKWPEIPPSFIHHISDLIYLDVIPKWSEILPRFVHHIFELLYPDSAVQCWRHRQNSKWSKLSQLFIGLGTGPQLKICGQFFCYFQIFTFFQKLGCNFVQFSSAVLAKFRKKQITCCIFFI